ncbi:hypothetical protein Tco_1112906 [Tanacetum coccineum]|uniref:Uncharacterized protein n=1 Tax=Tanacetum coccineum TaxID=301880 RepID=A0ABQ5ITP2_9ASTR
MGGSHSREGLDLSDYSDDEDDYKSQSDSEQEYKDAQEYDHKSSSAAVDDLDVKLKALKNTHNILLTTLTQSNCTYTPKPNGSYQTSSLITISSNLTMTSLRENSSVMKKRRTNTGTNLDSWYKDSGIKASDENKVKVYGKDFMGWAKPELAYGTMWETNEDTMWENSSLLSFKTRNDLLEEFEGVSVNGGMIRIEAKDSRVVDKGESNMLLMSGEKEGKPHSSGVNQLDIKTGKIMTEWKFEKDETEISMRDIENDTKWSQLDPSESTFLGRYSVSVSALHKRPRRNKVQYVEVILFYNGLDVPTKQILDSKGAIPTKTTADAKVAIQEMAESQLNNLGREIKKVNEKVYVAQVGCEQCIGPHYTKDSPLKEEGKTLEEACYTQFGAPFQQGGKYRAAAPGFYKETMQILHSTKSAIKNQGASIKALEIQIEQISKVLQERGFESLPSSTETNPRDHVKSISTTVEADMTPIAKGSYGLQCLDTFSYGATRADYSLPQKEKDPESFTLPCYIYNVCFENALADLGASVSVMPLSTYLNLGLGELAHTKLTVELADKTMKCPKGIAENVLVGIGKFVFLIDFDDV